MTAQKIKSLNTFAFLFRVTCAHENLKTSVGRLRDSSASLKLISANETAKYWEKCNCVLEILVKFVEYSGTKSTP